MKASTKYRQRLQRLAGREISGGCDDCNATQRLTDLGGGVFQAVIGHDDTCPAYRRMGGDDQ